jgi:hypothetical protein
MDKEKEVPEFILNNYDMSIDTRVMPNKTEDRLNIYTWIIFIPKEISPFTPDTVNFYSKHKSICDRKYNECRVSFEDASYIRHSEMPLLKYMSGEFYFDNFCEEISTNISNDITEKFKLGTIPEKRIPIKQKIYHTYWANNFDPSDAGN